MKIERETKVSLSAGDFDRLLSLGTVRRCTDQLNVYYDHAGALAALQVTCRLRLAGGRRPVMTVKLPGTRVGHRRDAAELEAELEGPPAVPKRWLDVRRDAPPELADCLAELGLQRLERMGWLRNRRWDVALSGFDLELDRTVLRDGSVFFEAEFESDDLAAHESVVAAIAQHAPSARPSRVSKYQRFVQSLPQSGRAAARRSSDGQLPGRR